MTDLHPVLPSRLKLPDVLLIGAFTLNVETYTRPGVWNAERNRFIGVSGTAWLLLNCAKLPGLILDPGSLASGLRLAYPLEVVAKVVYPQTQISLDAARLLQPGIQLGASLQISTDMNPQELQQLIVSGVNIVNWWVKNPPKGQVLVSFDEVSIARTNQRSVGRIVSGEAVYPAKPHIPQALAPVIEGFTLHVNALTLAPNGASADITLELPPGLADAASCAPATLPLGRVPMTPDCEFYIDRPDADFGPWIIGDTGMLMEGSGFVLDLSDTASLPGQLPAWKGLVLKRGSASGASLLPDPSNTAYLRGKFTFSNATVTASGLDAALFLSGKHQFAALQPLGYTVEFESGQLAINDSQISGGTLGPGRVVLPSIAVRKGVPSYQVELPFHSLAVQPNIDLIGELDCGGGLPLSWGELTHAGQEQVAGYIEATQAFLYLNASPLATFSPDSGSSFLYLHLSNDPATALNEMLALGMSGVALRGLRNLAIFSPDRPGGTSYPLKLDKMEGWLHVGLHGLDGQLNTLTGINSTELGDPAHPGYVGNQPFKAFLFNQDKLNLVAQLASSAVYDSNILGHLKIPDPCNIDRLDFEQMELTSTAHLVGGNIVLPAGGVTLDYWKLQLVPTGDRFQAGVISVRTGRLVFLAAGISEPIHFARPFNLIWGEMLADGNLGQLYFDYNTYGQRFDGFNYNPCNMLLSKYVMGATDGYLATCGTVHFNYFAAHFVNIRDARYDAVSGAPNHGRQVTCPKTGEAGWAATDLHLANTWYDDNHTPLALFDFPDAKMDYNVDLQNGFIGSGTTVMSFFHSDGLVSTIEVHAGAIDIRLSSLTSHDINVGLISNLSGMREICGCARIEGPLLERMEFYGLLEAASATGTGILEPKAGMMVEINITTTPNTFDFSAAGDMLLQAAGAAIDLSASVHLFLDYANHIAEGELVGRIICNSVLAGLEGEGQVTWHIGPDMQYLQGRMKVILCGWIGSGGMEGGFFLGNQVPSNLAWVLRTTSPHFGISSAILPATLTGLYGYGMLSFGINWYIFGGGIELYAGMGAFSEIPAGATTLWGIPGLPYVLGGCGIYVHGEILGGLVSASAWADLSLRASLFPYFEGNFGLEGCVLWVICASISVTAGFNSSGFYLN
jgi:hypothetical protein